jgi:hypothetical protein
LPATKFSHLLVVFGIVPVVTTTNGNHHTPYFFDTSGLFANKLALCQKEVQIRLFASGPLEVNEKLHGRRINLQHKTKEPKKKNKKTKNQKKKKKKKKQQQNPPDRSNCSNKAIVLISLI